MIHTVISDLGKVIIFFDNRIFFKKMSQFCSYSEEEIGNRALGELRLVQSFDRGEIAPQEFYSEVVQRLGATIAYDEFYSIYNDVFSLNTPALEVMKKLMKNYELVLLSNTDVMRFGFIRKKFPEIMIFDHYVLSFEVGFMKPHPQIYREALKRAGTDARDCVFIDDSEENVNAAEKLGIKGVLFTPNMDLKATLKSSGLSF
ncbi:MAG: HAD family hydrolase [Candidatus Aminicenantaceae bacterium]